MAEKIDPSTVADSFSEGEDFLSLEQLQTFREGIAEAKKDGRILQRCQLPTPTAKKRFGMGL